MQFDQQFEWTSGSVIGASHRKKGVNNQDSLKIYSDKNLFIGIVSDGCSANGNPNVRYARSDVGSALLSELLCTSILKSKKYLGQDNFFDILFDDICSRLENHLNNLSLEKNTNERHEYVEKYLQATLVACIIHEEKVYIFSCGDGLFFINGEQKTIEPQEGNMPVYLAYKFMPTVLSADVLENELKFHVHLVTDLMDIENLMIGTDGVQELIDAKDNIILIRNETIGDISHWWTKDMFFKNPIKANNWLHMMNDPIGDNPQHRGDHGYFSDDVTFIVIRKRKEVNNE